MSAKQRVAHGLERRDLSNQCSHAKEYMSPSGITQDTCGFCESKIVGLFLSTPGAKWRSIGREECERVRSLKKLPIGEQFYIPKIAHCAECFCLFLLNGIL